MEMYPAQLDGFPLEVEDIFDRFENAIVRHEIPGQAGAKLENMGQRARSVNFRCYFWDHGSHRTYAAHVDLINHLEKTSLFELVHPKYGVMKGMVESFDVRHDDRERTAEVDIIFIEELRGTIPDVPFEDVAASAEDALGASQKEQMESFSGDVREALGSDAVAILERMLDPARGILEQYAGFSRSAHAYLKTVETFVATVEGFLLDVANPANGVISAIDYGTSLPGRVIGAVARCVERYVILNESVRQSPARFLDNMEQGLLQLESVVPSRFAKHLHIGFAAQGAHALAEIYRDDEVSRQKLRATEKRQTFDTLGRYQGSSSSGEILTVNELEVSLAKSRSMLQGGIDQDRTMESFKTMARTLLDHVNDVKLERDRIITVEIDPEMPLHLVCLRYGLPYNMADRIASINELENPGFVSGKVQIYGR